MSEDNEGTISDEPSRRNICRTLATLGIGTAFSSGLASANPDDNSCDSNDSNGDSSDTEDSCDDGKSDTNATTPPNSTPEEQLSSFDFGTIQYSKSDLPLQNNLLDGCYGVGVGEYTSIELCTLDNGDYRVSTGSAGVVATELVFSSSETFATAENIVSIDSFPGEVQRFHQEVNVDWTSGSFAEISAVITVDSWMFQTGWEEMFHYEGSLVV